MTAVADRLALLATPAVRSAVAGALRATLEYHERTGSTQDRALALAPTRAIVVADEQTAGRGTKERRWSAPAGTSVLVSIVLPGPPPGAHVGSLIAGVAVARALDRCGAAGARLKWPNDVLLGGRKVAGILTQVASGARGALVAGIGLNVSQDEAGLGPLRPAATSLALEGVTADRLDVLALLVEELDRAFAAEPDAVLAEWRSRSDVLGRQVRVERAGEPAILGVAAGLDPDGALRVETAYGLERILAGEVVVQG